MNFFLKSIFIKIELQVASGPLEIVEGKTLSLPARHSDQPTRLESTWFALFGAITVHLTVAAAAAVRNKSL